MLTDKAKQDKAMAKYAKLMAKIEKYVEARRIAEEAFSLLKFGHKTEYRYETTQEWREVCEASGMHTSCDLGDLSC